MDQETLVDRLHESINRLLTELVARGQELLLVAQLAGSDGVPRPVTGYLGDMPIYGTAFVYAVPGTAPARPSGS